MVFVQIYSLIKSWHKIQDRQNLLHCYTVDILQRLRMEMEEITAQQYLHEKTLKVSWWIWNNTCMEIYIGWRKSQKSQEIISSLVCDRRIIVLLKVVKSAICRHVLKSENILPDINCLFKIVFWKKEYICGYS